MVLMIAPSETEESRVGLTVSRKVGTAVTRNRVKRRFREIIRTNATSLVRRFDHVVIAFAPAADASFSALQEELIWLLERARRSQTNSVSGNGSSSR